jgi:AcrR family transcriptional regulator
MGRERIIEDPTAIVEHAFALIDEDGYDRFSTRRLAARLHVSHMTLYNYFDREELLKRVIELGFARFNERFLPLAAPQLRGCAAPGCVLRIVADQLVEFARDHTRIYRFMFGGTASELTRDPRISGLYTSGVDLVKGALPAELEPRLRRDAYLFFVLVNGLILAWLDERHGTTLEACRENIDRAHELILGSYG